jgi:hypothetical protein
MAQYGVPVADVADGDWTDQAASNVDMFEDIVPGTPGSIGGGDDATYAQSGSNPSSDACEFDLTLSLEDPVSSTGHIMRWRRQKSASGGGTINMIVNLREGSTGGNGTLINGFADNTLPDTWATTSDELTGGEADAINNYDDLQIEFIATQT